MTHFKYRISAPPCPTSPLQQDHRAARACLPDAASLGTLRLLSPERPLATRRKSCTPFLLLACGLHALALAVPLTLPHSTVDIPTSPPLLAHLQAPGKPETPKPATLSPARPLRPAAPPTMPTRQASPRLETTAASATSAQPAAAPSESSTPEAISAPTGKASASPTPTVSAARFDAAYLNNPPPSYPARSRRLNESGKVLLKVRISAEGQAVAVDVAQSSNFTRLDEAAKQAVSGWRFIPAKRGNQAIEADVIVPIVFGLDD